VLLIRTYFIFLAVYKGMFCLDACVIYKCKTLSVISSHARVEWDYGHL